MPSTQKITPQAALQRVIEHREIFHDEMLHLMRLIMSGEMSPVMTAAIVTGLRVKKETIGEITAAAQVMREFATPVQVSDDTHLVDIVGTGGDGSHTFNISTCTMFVAAAAGARTAKHGGRSVSSKSGSADVLEALGVNINLPPERITESIQTTGIGFMFAPNHHPAMKNVAPVRKELGVRTLFNILGPLTNPAGAPNILMGVFHPDLVGIQVRVLQRLGAEHALVVYGRDGMDEVSLGAATLVGELKNGEIRVLVATDIASRGIDVDGITHVVNFDFPDQLEDYVHRIGRTGRALSTGTAITFITREDLGDLRRLERIVGKHLHCGKLPGFDYTQQAPARTPEDFQRHQDPRAGAHNSEREGRPQGGRHGGYRAAQGNYRPFGRPGTRRQGGPK